ncbi:MAG TPA: cyclic nucleotide-binding domain-containing protein [Rhodocyclaceae bacterium]|nr:cyclic nucleotide-binding domain-containing protein [Rhodocyclaceae bacterium]
MDDLDFVGAPTTPPPKTPPAPAARPVRKSEPSPLYDAKLALDFFKLAGTAEQFPVGATIFEEGEKTRGLFSKGARVYLLLDGGVALTRQGKPLDLVMPGEIFGEMAVIAETPRSASASAWKNSRVLSLDEKQFLNSLQQIPEFALMLIAIMAQRLHRSVAKLIGSQQSPSQARVNKNTLDKKLLADLRSELGDPPLSRMQAGGAIVMQGATGVFMYVVVEGRIAIAASGRTLEYVESGGVFGEMALIDNAGRAASATAETASAWFVVARNDLLSLVAAKPSFGIALLRSMSERIRHIGDLLCAEKS